MEGWDTRAHAILQGLKESESFVRSSVPARQSDKRLCSKIKLDGPGLWGEMNVYSDVHYFQADLQCLIALATAQ